MNRCIAAATLLSDRERSARLVALQDSGCQGVIPRAFQDLASAFNLPPDLGHCGFALRFQKWSELYGLILQWIDKSQGAMLLCIP